MLLATTAPSTASASWRTKQSAAHVMVTTIDHISRPPPGADYPGILPPCRPKACFAGANSLGGAPGRRYAVRPRTARTIQINKHAPMNPRIR